MKILIMSDSHGNAKQIEQTIKTECPDAIIHLGDGWRDLPQDIGIPCWRVRGNCDGPACSFPEKQIIEFGNVRVFITHGHLYNVKFSLMRLKLAAMEADASLALFGHTHSAFMDFDVNGTSLFNPGTIGRSSGSYGIMETDGKEFTINHVSLQDT